MFTKPAILSRNLVWILLTVIVSFTAQAGDKPMWNNKQAAVVLTYDDGVPEQLTHAVPLLNALNMKATFYLTPGFEGFKEHVQDWKKVAAQGHELGNHTLFHPCRADMPGRDWVRPEYDLSKYTVQQMVEEIELTNTVLAMLDGRQARTFAYPCGDMTAGGKSYVDEIRKDVTGARAVDAKMVKIDDVDLYRIPSYMINGESGDELINLVKQAVDQQELLVFLFHGVGGGHGINVSVDAHNKLLRYLKKHEDQVWVAPLVDVTRYLAEYRNNKQKM